MTTINGRLQITEIDFDLIKTNIQAFMQGQTTFSDYNFTGSGLSMLLNALSYNTHYGAYYVNMLANEIGISTAQVRDNINKLAKALNYVPGSMTAPTAFVNVIVTPGTNQPTLTLPAYTPFQSQAINGQNFTYVTTQSYTATQANGQFFFSDVALQEGIVINYTYTADTTNPRNSFNIPSANIDINTLIVTVTENTPPPSVIVPYQLALDVSLLTGNSRVYFLEGSTGYTYNMYFGDGIFGRALIPGDTATATYLSTNGPLSNQANSFTLMSPIGGFSNVVVQAVTASAGGSLADTNDQVRFNAPLAYTTQERAVTLQDYIFLLKRDYKNISSLALWGGDQNNPPIYGKVFMSIRPVVGQYLSNVQKQQILSILSQYTLQTSSNTPQIVDPDYTYLLLSVNAYYNPNKTTLTQSQLIANIQQAIYQYGVTQLGQFNTAYVQSDVNDVVKSTDASILGSQVTTFLQKRFFPTLGQSVTYTLNFNTALKQGGLLEKLYSSPGFTQFDSFGNLQNCFIEENINTYQGITNIVINDPGFNYTSTPTVIISGDGQGAAGHAVIVNGLLQTVVLDTQGEGYSFATATVVGGGGYGALITPILAAETGILDTYYYTNTNKFILNPIQGNVDHVLGLVILNNFMPLDIENQTKQLTVNVKPNNDLVVPQQNQILLIDPTDINSVTVQLTPTITQT